MEFQVNKDHFANGLQQVLNIVGMKASMPVLTNVLIKTIEEGLCLTTTNLELGIRCQIKAQVKVKGSITLPVRKLHTIIKELPNNLVNFELSKKNQAKITSGGSIFRIMGIDEEDFPALPDFDDRHVFNLEQEKLLKMLRSVSYSESTDENRYVLNGVFFNFKEDKLSLVATDGRRLALINEELKIEEENSGGMILPAKTVAELQRLLGKGDKVKITFNDRQVAFFIQVNDKVESHGLTDNIYLVSKVVDGNYPNYQQVIPEITTHRIKIERELLLECVKRAALVISDKNNSVTLKISNNLLEITGNSSEFGESHESIAIQFEQEKGMDPIKVAFNPNFLIEPLKALTQDEIFFEFKDEMSPGIFKNMEHFICVIMPLRLPAS